MTTKTLEEAYFHINNGGLTLRVNQEEDGPNRLVCRLEVEACHFGPGLKLDIPLSSPEMVLWLHEATGRLLQVMVQDPERCTGLPFEKSEGCVSVRNGEPTGYNHTRGPGLQAQIDGTYSERLYAQYENQGAAHHSV